MLTFSMNVPGSGKGYYGKDKPQGSL